MTKCSECGKKIKSGERFLLEGDMPFAPATNALYGLGIFGDCFHKECYFKNIKDAPEKRYYYAEMVLF